MSNTYCPLLWVHTSLQNGNTILPCCAFMDSSMCKTGSFHDQYHSDEMNAIREKMLAGQPVAGCSQCYAQERSGLESMRQRALKKYGMVSSIELKDVHIVFDNLCNLKCRMCASPSSHLWYDEEKLLYGESFTKNKYFQNTFYKEINFKGITEINITGGEPLYSPHFIPFLKKVMSETNASEVSLAFFTNGTIKIKQEILDLLKSFKKVDVTVSIDAIGRLNNFIRKNSNFKVIEENLNFLNTLVDDKFSVSVLTTIGIYNGIHIEKIKKYFKEKYSKFRWRYDFIQYLPHLSLKHMPIELKKLYSKQIKEQPVLSFMNEPAEDLFSHFLHFHNKLNEIRKETFVGNSTLNKFINNCSYTVSSEETMQYYKKMLTEIKDNDI